MGTHICEFCKGRTESNICSNTGSGNNKIETKDMRIFFPDLVLHYVVDHQWQPPDFFIDTIMGNDPHELAKKELYGFTKNEKGIERVGFLTSSIPAGKVPPKFKERLIKVMMTCEKTGNRWQSKGL
jgi:hypothetical protein